MECGNEEQQCELDLFKENIIFSMTTSMPQISGSGP
jgi:hypothetical protein